MISEIIEKWIKGILIDGITGNLSGLFDNVNAKVGEIASDVGSTPQAWNSGIFNMLRSLSETVVLPIAAAILALVMCHELIQMITEKNNMHDFDTSMFFRWIFKSAFAILIVSNTWNIVMGVFDATQSVVNQSSGVIIGETSIHFDRLIPGLEFQLESMTIGSLLSLWFQTLVVGLTMNILSICIIQDQIWGRVTQNRSQGRATWYFADEFHLLLKEEQTAAYSAEIWKRFRKWGGVPTGATQNVKDLLSSPEIENILENSDFITLLNQASGDRKILSERLNLSADQQKYIDNSEPGEGLLIFENVVLPFSNPIPKNTQLYKIMTTRLSEVVEL